MAARTPVNLSIAERLSLGGNLTLREFCAWAQMSHVTAYLEAKDGRLRIAKLRGKAVVTGPDALSYRDALAPRS
jgi:hypothetical protein